MKTDRPTPKIEEKALNDVPGFLCPNCRKIHIKLSLPQFLSNARIACPVCNMEFDMDKSACVEMISMLQELNIATENVRALKNKGS